MKIIYSLMICVFFTLGNITGQSSISELATSFGNAYLNKDYTTILKLTHPDIILKGGGEEFALTDLKANLENPKSDLIEYTSIEVGEPLEYFKSGDQTQTFVPVRFFLEFNDELYANNTHFFATSTDDENWRFVNLEYYDQASLKVFIDNINEEMIIPENKPFQKLNKEEK